MADIAVPLREFKHGYEEEGVIKGFKCQDCDNLFVTVHGVCPSCRSRNLEDTEFKGVGTVRAYTVMAFSSERYMDYAPFAYICVRLDEGADMSGWIPGIMDASELAIGDRVRYYKTYKPGVVFEKVTDDDDEEEEEEAADGPGSEWLSFGA